MPKTTSLTLIRSAKASDPEAWTTLFVLYTPLIRIWCLRCGLNPFDAEDVCQDVCSSVYQGLCGFDRSRDGQSFRGWLRTITRNRVIDVRRKAGREGNRVDYDVSLEPFRPDLSDLGHQSESEILLEKALQILRSKHGEQKFLAFWKGHTEGHEAVVIAEELNMNVNKVYLAKSRLARELKSLLSDDPD